MTSESDIQIACIQYLDRLIEEGVELRYCHPANEINPYDARTKKINFALLNKRKKMGVSKGAVDLIIAIPCTTAEYGHKVRREEVLFIELKTNKGKLSKAQDELREWYLDNGFNWHLLRAANVYEAKNQMKEILKEYLLGATIILD